MEVLSLSQCQRLRLEQISCFLVHQDLGQLEGEFEAGARSATGHHVSINHNLKFNSIFD